MIWRTLLVVLVVLGAACGGADKKEEPETVIGTPPSPKDDPFFFVAMPAEAVPASSRGTIGDGESPPPDGPTAVPDPAEPAEPAVPAAAETEPKRRSQERRAKRTPTGSRCFSCVRICPETVSDADCGEDYDTICGWGRSDDRSVAAEIASAECDAALDLARSGSRYSKITGRCPAASCR